MRFALVIFETDASRQAIQEDRNAFREAYQTWIGKVAAEGKLVGGEAFDTAGAGPVTVRKAADGTATAAHEPVFGAAETLGGWFVVDVADQDEAVELARALPTPETVEIRPILESA
ncbi:YciI family protein [Spirillospora sp. NPDC049652]